MVRPAPTLQYSTTPILQYSNTPPLHHSTTPPLHHSTTPSLHSSTSPRQCEEERGSFIGFGFRPDTASMAQDDALDQGEAHPRSLEFRRRMQTLENPE